MHLDDHVTLIGGSQSRASSNDVNWHKDIIKISLDINMHEVHCTAAAFVYICVSNMMRRY